ncbi:MAG TPA: hypothetical protein VL049_25925 [Candidatus Dormibacteraeota bacterium]|nr:hypothetical protein [Candidatus Dormibacteraeota bacterium]
MAATYYVDPTTGANSNAGTTASAAWRNPPGTRTANDSGFASSAWGPITSANKVACGDVILLKGGATQTSAQGGAWRIDPSYYSSCTPAQRIVLRVATAAEWSGSAGPFTIDGTGMTPTYDITYAFGDHAALIAISNRNYIEIRGASATQRLVVRNSTSWSVVVACNGNCSGAGQGFRGDFLELANSSDGFNIGNWNQWQVSNSIGHDIRYGPWQTGLNNDWKVDQGAFVNVQGYDSGCGSVAAPTCTSGAGKEDLFFLVGGRGVWCIDCQAYRGGERGVNTGVIQDSSMGGDFNFRFRNLRAWDNGATCSGGGPHYCAGAGIYISGNDFVNADVARNYVVGGVIFHNADMGAGAYGGGAIEIWNAVTYNTNWKRSDTGSYMLDRTAKDVRVFNGIDVRDATTTAKAFTWGNANSALPQKLYTPTSLSNCFRPLSSNSEALGVNDGAGWPGAGTYAAPPAWIPSSSNKAGLTLCDPKFTTLDATTYANNNFQLQLGSTAIDAGRFLLRANGAGTNATIISVKANGGSADPRNFFIAPNSYLDALPDTIQIEGCGRVAVTAATATSISFTPACSWADNAGIHLPWAGAAPDMGPFEFGLGSSVPPPTLISVAPIAP